MEGLEKSTSSGDLLSHFDRLSKDVSYNRPPTEASTSTAVSTTVDSSSSPTLIVLCTWIGARDRHIAKYVQGYHDIYPAAEILVIRSGLADMTYRSDRAQDARLASSLSVAKKHMATTSDQPGRVLVQAFSNGGAQCLGQLFRLFAGDPSCDTASVEGIVFDSCPGDGSFRRAAKAILLTFPQNILVQVVAFFLVWILGGVVWVLDRVFGVRDVVTVARERLGDVNLFAKTDVPRLYLYSKADQMVLARDVSEHAAEARRLGCRDVREVEFEDSGHCAHAAMHGERYWKAIQDLMATCK